VDDEGNGGHDNNGVKMTKMVVCFFTAFLAVVYITVVFDILEIRVFMENYLYLCILGSRLYVSAHKYYCYLMQIRDGVFNVFFVADVSSSSGLLICT
jgi:hypothetical protein